MSSNEKLFKQKNTDKATGQGHFICFLAQTIKLKEKKTKNEK